MVVSVTAQFGDKFEWYREGKKVTPDEHPHCHDFDSPNLVISPFLPEYEGRYKCRVSNKAGYVESNDGTLSK